MRLIHRQDALAAANEALDQLKDEQPAAYAALLRERGAERPAS